MILLNSTQSCDIYLYSSLQSPAEEMAFEEYLFNTDAHLFQQDTKPPWRFYLIHKKKNRIIAKVSLFLENKVAISPSRATFGGIMCASDIPPLELINFIKTVGMYLEKQGIEEITFKMYPEIYDTDVSALIEYTLLQAGYTIQTTDLNYHLLINEQAFDQKIHPSKKRILKKCQNQGFSFQKMENPNLIQIHEFIYQARLRRGHPMSLQQIDFIRLVQKFPDDFIFFQVQSSSKEIASMGVVIRINSQILYHFYPADSDAYLAQSPNVMLNEGIYRFAQTQGYQLLDLGIATNQGKLNEGLARFKVELGAEKSLKLTFFKKPSL